MPLLGSPHDTRKASRLHLPLAFTALARSLACVALCVASAGRVGPALGWLAVQSRTQCHWGTPVFSSLAAFAGRAGRVCLAAAAAAAAVLLRQRQEPKPNHRRVTHRPHASQQRKCAARPWAPTSPPASLRPRQPAGSQRPNLLRVEPQAASGRC